MTAILYQKMRQKVSNQINEPQKSPFRSQQKAIYKTHSDINLSANKFLRKQTYFKRWEKASHRKSQVIHKTPMSNGL